MEFKCDFLNSIAGEAVQQGLILVLCTPWLSVDCKIVHCHIPSEVGELAFDHHIDWLEQ